LHAASKGDTRKHVDTCGMSREDTKEHVDTCGVSKEDTTKCVDTHGTSRGVLRSMWTHAIMLLVYQPSIICCSKCIDIRMKVKKTNIHKHASLMDNAWEDI
jgi:hypothetical protein